VREVSTRDDAEQTTTSRRKKGSPEKKEKVESLAKRAVGDRKKGRRIRLGQIVMGGNCTQALRQEGEGQLGGDRGSDPEKEHEEVKKEEGE